MSRPRLDGEHIVITRAASQATPLRQAFEHAGAVVTLWPLIEITSPEDPAPLHRAMRERDRYDWIVFTSANAVSSFFTTDFPSDELAPLHARIASIGPATSAQLRKHGITVALEAEIRTGSGLAQALEPNIASQSRILVPQAADARPELIAELSKTEAVITSVTAYRKRLPTRSREMAAELLTDDLGWVTITSPRIARAFSSLAAKHGTSDLRFRALSIGPTTSTELRRLGITPVESHQPTPAGMVAAIAASNHEERDPAQNS